MTKKRQRRKKPARAQKLLDIIIPVREQFDLLEECLNAIPDACGDISYNIICVDNASEKIQADTFYNERQDIIVIRNGENEGFPRACNTGARRKNASLLFFLNSDVILKPESVSMLVRAMDDPTIGIVGMRLLFSEFKEGLNPQIRPAGKVQHIGISTDIRGMFIHHLMGWSADHPKVMEQKDTHAVTGAALMTRRSIWNKVGGFLEDYGLGTFEDVDYCLSVRELGYNIIVVPEATGIHYTGATAERTQTPYPLQHNHMLLMQRWGSRLQWTEWRHY